MTTPPTTPTLLSPAELKEIEKTRAHLERNYPIDEQYESSQEWQMRYKHHIDRLLSHSKALEAENAALENRVKELEGTLEKVRAVNNELITRQKGSPQ